jgi:peptidoglycan/LPS O-acetylase OafA/YrhL
MSYARFVVGIKLHPCSKIQVLPAKPAKTRIPELDGLRGIAILLVLFYHYVSIPPGQISTQFPQTIFAIGWSGVDLFFVLSGFLIGGMLLDVRESPNYFKTFYGRRFYRIVPLYYLSIAAYFGFEAFRTAPETWHAIPSTRYFCKTP